MAIEIANRQRLVAIDKSLIADVAQAALDALRHMVAAGPTPLPSSLPPNRLQEPLSATVAFVRDPAIRKLNRDFRGKDRATDVLSFPAYEGDKIDGSRLDGEPLYLGDIVISVDTALSQARLAGHSFEREASELIIHGVLHLCGYDHESDDGEMNRIELKIRRKLLDRDRRARAARSRR